MKNRKNKLKRRRWENILYHYNAVLCTRMATLCFVLTQVTHVHLFYVLAVMLAVILTFTSCNKKSSTNHHFHPLNKPKT